MMNDDNGADNSYDFESDAKNSNENTVTIQHATD